MDKDELRKKIMGFGDNSIRKTYFPQCQEGKTDLELFHSMMDVAYDGVLLLNISKGVILDMNKTASKFYQVESSEFLGKPFRSLISSDDLLMRLDMHSTQPESKSCNFTTLLQTKGGFQLPVDATLSYKYLDHSHYAILILRDITKRILVQKALVDSEHRYRDLFNTTSEAIFIHDYDTGAVVDVNDTMLRMYRCTKEQAKKLPMSFFSEGVVPYDISHIQYWIQQAKERGAVVLEWRARRFDGEIFWAEIYLRKSKIYDADVILAAVRDISEKKDAEFAVKKQNKKLQEYNNDILEINSQLEREKQKAQESDRLKSAFLANISHEIRTPLNGVVGFANLLNSDDLDVDTRENYVGIINQSSEQLLSIITDIVDIAKIESGEMDINKTEFELFSCLDELMAIAEIEKNKRGKENLSVTVDFSQCLVSGKIITDKEKLKKVCSNLLNNAIKYTDSGEISVACFADESSLRFSVSDTGKGIDKRYHHEIFNRFSQTAAEYGEVAEGNGLGLAISKGIIDLLGGKIWVESEIGKGATFYFTLPL